MILQLILFIIFLWCVQALQIRPNGGCLIILVLDTFKGVLTQHSVCGGLDFSITVVSLGNTVDEKPLQALLLLSIADLMLILYVRTYRHTNTKIVA